MTQEIKYNARVVWLLISLITAFVVAAISFSVRNVQEISVRSRAAETANAQTQ